MHTAVFVRLFLCFPRYSVLCFEQNARQNLLSIVVSILHLGQIEFDGDVDSSSIRDRGPCVSAAKFAGVTAEALESTLTVNVLSSEKGRRRLVEKILIGVWWIVMKLEFDFICHPNFFSPL
jgi:hypothetical protein